MNPIAASITATTALTVLSLSSSPAWAQSFGRLFHTPTQRLELDQGKPRLPRASATPAPAPAPAVVAMRIDGIVRHSDGHGTVWLNGEMQGVPPGLRLVAGERRELIPSSAPHLRLQVGDIWRASEAAAAVTPTGRIEPTADTPP